MVTLSATKLIPLGGTLNVIKGIDELATTCNEKAFHGNSTELLALALFSTHENDAPAFDALDTTLDMVEAPG